MKHLALAIVAIVLTACGHRAPPPLIMTRSADPAQLERGQYLAQSLAACGFCHGDRPVPGAALAGGRELVDNLGPLRAANITPARSGIGSWDVDDLATFLRKGVTPTGQRPSPDMHKGYEWLSDNDLAALIAYLRNIPAVQSQVAAREVDAFDKRIDEFFRTDREVEGFVPDVPRGDSLAYGRYLVDHVARCGSCHSRPETIFGSEQYLAGGLPIRFDGESKQAPDITNSQVYGLGSWSEADIVAYLRSGRRPDGTSVDTRYCPVPFYQRSQESDLLAIAKFLKAKQAS